MDFGGKERELLAGAFGQAKVNTEFILIHIVESPSAILHGSQTADYESQKDKETLDSLVMQVREKGYKAEGILGYRHSAKEIVRIVQETNIDMLVIGAHGHTGFKDFIYGATVNTVRHELKIPVLVVTL